MRLSTALTLALTALLITSTLGAVAASPSEPPATDSSSSSQAAITTHQSTDSHFETADSSQEFHINVTDTGDAEWTIESRFLLADDDEVETFEAFASDHVNEETYPITAFDQARETIESSTDREMSIEDDRWNEPRTETPNDNELDEIDDSDDLDVEDARVGVISYSFTWTNFGEVDGDRIYVQDAFEDGDLFPFLDADQRLVIHGPSGYEGATPGGDDGTYEWEGYTELDDEPDLVFIASSESEGWFTLGWLGGGFLLFAVIFGVGGYLLVQRRSDLEWIPDRLPPLALPGSEDDPEAGSSAGTTDNTAAANTAPPANDSPYPDTARDAELEFDEGADIDPSLLSDEERVQRMLNENGGRMKQATIVKETGWSNAKVSQLLSKMDDDEEIEKLRIGRENLITLPEVDPTEID